MNLRQAVHELMLEVPGLAKDLEEFASRIEFKVTGKLTQEVATQVQTYLKTMEDDLVGVINIATAKVKEIQKVIEGTK